MKFAIVFAALVACVASHAVVVSHHGNWDHGHGHWNHAPAAVSVHHAHPVVVSHHVPTVYAAHHHNVQVNNGWDHGHHGVVAHHGSWAHGHDDGSWDHARYGDHSSWNHGHWDGHHAVAHVAHAPVHHSASYVAKNRGAVHHAPLAGHVVSQTSLNVAPAPGTW